MSETKSLVTVYGDAPEGEHPAIFVSAQRTKYPKGPRLIFQFLILNSDQESPLENEEGEPYYAVAVCNVSKGTNPKSKAYKICKAMLRPDEYDPVEVAIAVPSWEHFAQENPDGTRRIIWVRVERRGPIGQLISLVTHIKKPRDGVWEHIEGKFDGRRHFPWLNKDGSFRGLSKEEDRALFASSPDDYHLYEFWNNDPPRGSAIWLDKQGQFVPLSPEQISSLDGWVKDFYRVAQHKAELGQLPVAGGDKTTEVTQSESNAAESTTRYAAAAPGATTAGPPSVDVQGPTINESGELREEMQPREITEDIEELIELLEKEGSGRPTKS